MLDHTEKTNVNVTFNYFFCKKILWYNFVNSEVKGEQIKMEKEPCGVCPRGHVNRSTSIVTTSNWPLLNIDRPKGCQEYYPPIKRIEAVRFVQPANAPWGHTPWTNLLYRPIIKGGLKYFGVNKLVPLGLPPNSPVLSRPTPVRKTDCPGLVVYCDSRIC